MSKIIISSVPNFVNVLSRNQALLAIPAFMHLKPILQQASQLKGCNCNKGTYLQDKRKIFESAMATMQESDKQQMKSILKVDKVCYYVLNSQGKLDLSCF